VTVRCSAVVRSSEVVLVLLITGDVMVTQEFLISYTQKNIGVISSVWSAQW